MSLDGFHIPTNIQLEIAPFYRDPVAALGRAITAGPGGNRCCLPNRNLAGLEEVHEGIGAAFQLHTQLRARAAQSRGLAKTQMESRLDQDDSEKHDPGRNRSRRFTLL